MQEAILPLIIATTIAISFIYLTEKKVPTMPLISGILLAGFGGLTLYFNDKTFFYMKPTIINLDVCRRFIVWKAYIKDFPSKKSSWTKLKVNRRWMEYSHRQMDLFFYFYCYT